MALSAVLRLAVALTCIASCQSVVIGIDVGAEFMKIGLVKPGTPFQIVTNLESGRKTEVMVGFNEGERVFGGGAVNLFARKPHLTYHGMRVMMGRDLEHPRVVHLREKEYFPIDMVANETTNRISLVHNKGSEDETTFSVEMLMAMLLTYAKEMTTAFGEGVKVRDCVICVPSFFTQNERQSILDAASLVGFKVLSLIDENTAAAVQYGIDRVYDNSTHNVLYYNMGSNSLQVSIAQYGSRVVKEAGKNKTIGTFAIKGKAWDEGVGGGHFDLLLTNFVADAFNKSPKRKGKPDVRTLPRPIAKIKKAVQKTKRVLSANKNTAVNIAGLADDIDFNVPITREEFEEMGKGLFERVTPAIDEALKNAKMEKSDIDSVEILGGGVRIPKVKALLKEYFGEKELGVHLNGDEAFALGAAFVAANKSATFRVRHVGMQDISPFAIGVRLTDLEKEQDKDKKWTKRVTVFKKNNKMGSNKVVAFQHTRDFSCAFNYDNKESLPQGTSSQISVYNVSGVEDFVASLQKKNVTGKPKVHLSFKLDSSGLVHLVKAEATLIQMVQPKIEEPDANATNFNSTEFNGTTSEDQAANATESESSNATNSTGNETVAIKEPPKPTKKTHRSVLTVIRTDTNITFKKMSDEERKDIIDALREMDHQDDLRKEKAAAKNNLEAFMYESKDKLNTNEEDVSKVTTEDQRSGILQELEDTDEWLYGDGDDLPAADYKEKQRALGKKVDAIFVRVSEFTERPKAVEKLQNKMNSSLNLISKWETSKPQITAMEREEVFNITTKLGAWLEEKQALQGKLESHEEPAFTAKEALIKMRPLNAIISRLSKRPKPIPKAIPKPTNATDSSNSTNATNTSEGIDAGNETKPVETETSDAESDKTEEDDSSKEEL